MRQYLIAWVGVADLFGPSKVATGDTGPIAQALAARLFDRVVLLEHFSKPEHQSLLPGYIAWLKEQTKVEIVERPEVLSGPTDFRGIYEAARRACSAVLLEDKGAALTFHLSPGSPSMAAVWMLLGKTIFPAELIESSREQGVRTADVPFDITAEFIPDLLDKPDERLRSQTMVESSSTRAFGRILHRSEVMVNLIQKARRIALRNVPVLIEGESGTGKELFAKAIHEASPRRDKPFISVNCGAIPAALVESVLFGHEKGAFTGAVQQHQGVFEQADGGTLLLDELGELPLEAQVKLLRVLQEGKIKRIGSTREVAVDVRVVSATNRSLLEEVAAGRFREDLFYRLAVAVLQLPALRDRGGDVGVLIDNLLAQENEEAKQVEPGYKYKRLSEKAKDVLRAYGWPGNVRELQLTLRRMVIWSDAEEFSAEDAHEHLLVLQNAPQRGVLGRPLGDDFNLKDVQAEVARHYLRRALDEAGGNKTQAAKLVGASNYQTLSNWLTKYGVEG